ncbi:transcriptional regulator, AraC family [Hymenobacter gelipurpurascens]|uniref:Transcriptional regulator, AraC family n=1 Tax=Hymenobacter gelipurpurascens TaxID=89968 RepID=A0A212TGS3_9BACT|nr:helix-turn-helix domain-containing protein [Hymenobacter gelipurpurascens]SNC65203.1 transcriptional regulator, AraC family [Hymenobacter gelipurpurascens]
MNNLLVSSTSGFDTVDLKLRGFKVYEIDTAVSPVPSYSRRDFYKICLITGRTNIHFADKSVELDDTFLFFGNPHIPYSSEVLTPHQTGFACLFTEELLKANDRSEPLQQSPLFKVDGTPIFQLNEEQKERISGIYRQMLVEQQSDYVYKQDLIRSYLNVIIHEALRMQPTENFVKHKNASSRIASLFLDLLERQFPIESPQSPLRLKSAHEFADQLAIHVNHLNRAVKEVTGKPTSAHIAERIISEARALLQHTSWSVAEIAYSLGFEYPAYFTNYFKKITGTTPSAVRESSVVVAA